MPREQEVSYQANPLPTILRLAIEELPARLADLESEISNGRSIELLRGGEVIAEVRAVNEKASSSVRPNAPDFMARMRARWSNRIFNDSTQWIREDRDAQY